ncbi:hypothetical protein ACJX0J_014550, partial [Zea mays]
MNNIKAGLLGDEDGRGGDRMFGNITAQIDQMNSKLLIFLQLDMTFTVCVGVHQATKNTLDFPDMNLFALYKQLEIIVHSDEPCHATAICSVSAFLLKKWMIKQKWGILLPLPNKQIDE